MFHRNNIFHLKYTGNDLSNQPQHRVLASGSLTALTEKPRITGNRRVRPVCLINTLRACVAVT